MVHININIQTFNLKNSVCFFVLKIQSKGTFKNFKYENKLDMTCQIYVRKCKLTKYTRNITSFLV
ncbi:hypothetical protein BpHYR1_027948, partial [Brachionus plicatilis]